MGMDSGWIGCSVCACSIIVGGFILVKEIRKEGQEPGRTLRWVVRLRFYLLIRTPFYWSLPHSWPLFPGHSAWAVKVKCPSLLVTPLNS